MQKGLARPVRSRDARAEVSGAQSIHRAMALLREIASRGRMGSRLVDLARHAKLPGPTSNPFDPMCWICSTDNSDTCRCQSPPWASPFKPNPTSRKPVLTSCFGVPFFLLEHTATIVP